MRKILRKLNNSGATLVMVIVAMLFIGIISVAVLALAMGNFGNTQTVTKASDSFYTAETVNDSLKICLQQYANQAAKEAYMEQLQNGVVEAAAFQTSFREKFADKLSGKDGDDFLAEIQSNTSETLSGYTIKMDYVNTPNFRTEFLSSGVIKNVEVIHVEDGTNVTTNLCSDFQISAVAPPLVYVDPDKLYKYDVDKYLFVSDADVVFGDNIDEMAGTNNATGSIFANGNINIQTSSILNLSAKNIISSNKNSTEANAKGNFNMNKGTLSIMGFGKKFQDVHKTGSYDPIDNVNGNVWCDNFDVENGTVVISTKTTLYLGDDLTLEGNGTVFSVGDAGEPGANGGIIAYSTSSKASDADVAAIGGGITRATAHKKSGSIVINGKNAKLDLSNLKKLYLAGQAYTEIPDIAGSTTATNMYFAQGESLTYKSLQSIYLVDGAKLYYDNGGERVYVGSNPMKEADFNAWKDGGYSTDATVPTGVLATDKFEFKSVQYSSGAIYYYVYWKFTDADYAVGYFNNVKSDALGKQKLSAIGTGFIKLPTAGTVSSKGNLIGYDGTNFTSVGGGLSAAASSECASAKLYYNNIKTSLSSEYSMDNGDAAFDVFDSVLFAGNKLGLITTGKRIYDLTEPVQNTANGVVAIEGGVAKKDTKDYSYKLIVSNSDLDFSSSDFTNTLTKYVIICKGKVTFDSVDFKGIVFAKGGVKVSGSGNNFECLGNYMYAGEGVQIRV